MIDPTAFCSTLKKAGYDFVTGVPDSLLKELSKNFIKIFQTFLAGLVIFKKICFIFLKIS